MIEDHPIASCWRLMRDDELASLVSSIKDHGLRKEIVLYEGKILDGRNRYRACIAAGVKPVTVNYLGSDPLEYAIDCNRERRHESVAERATAAAKLANLKRGDAATQRSDSPTGESLVSREEAAKKLGVSGSSIDRARAVLAKGTPEVIEQMSKGEITVNEAFENVKKGRPIAEKSILREGLVLAKRAMSLLMRIEKDDKLRFDGFKHVHAQIEIIYPRLKNYNHKDN